MKSVTRKLKRYRYSFGNIVNRDGNYDVQVTRQYDSYEILGTRKIKELADNFNAQFISMTSTLVKAEVAIETFIANANITEI